MITLSQPSNSERTYVAEAPKPADMVETSGSLAMLFQDGLMTMGQYDEYVSSNPFAVDYSMYSSFESADTVAFGGFLGDFASAVSALGGDAGASFASAGFASASCGSCGGFSSFC